MEVDPSPAVTPLTQEVRLATTMTGGVSLAIWMAGVAREINLVAQASQWRRVGVKALQASGLNPAAQESLGLYKKLLDLLDIVVDVDILSGTSAGGINAALLASTRVTGRDLGGLRDIWLDLGALTDLMRNPTDATVPSLLYGDERMLRELVEQIPHLKPGPFVPDDYAAVLGKPSTTLYVTTTLLDGEASEFTDSFGTLVNDVDRRGVFTFTENDLAEDAILSALALAARSSASFPAAFEPSFVPFVEPVPPTKDVPGRPAMAKYISITRPHWVADGGLLDNQPIDVLLQRIFDRPAERSVRRVLLFVVPSSGPDIVKAPEPIDVDKPLGLLDGLFKDLGAVTTQSISADLRTIRSHQDRMEARTAARLRLAELATRLSGSRLLTRELFDDYKTREASRQAQVLSAALLRQLGTWSSDSDSPTGSIPPKWQPQLAIGGNAAQVCRESITESIVTFWSQGADPPTDPATLARYGQAAFGVTKAVALAVVQVAYQLASDDADLAALARMTKGIHTAEDIAAEPDSPSVQSRATRWSRDLTEIVLGVCTDETNRSRTLKDAAAALADEYLKGTAVSEQAWTKLGQVFTAHRDTLTSLAKFEADADSAGPDTKRAAASQLNIYLKYLGPSSNSQVITIRLFDLAVAQRAMLPAEADIEQPLELVQVSADTRSLLAPNFSTAEQKLTGMQLHHFGAFYKRSWRANDWMWGRLDGAGWLVHVLLDPRRILRVVHARVGDRLQGENNAQWFIRQLKKIGAPDFPDSGYQLPATGSVPAANVTEQTLLDELKFLDDLSVAVPPSIPNTSLWLARVWQHRVLDEELSTLATTVVTAQQGRDPDWSPTRSRSWAHEVLAAVRPEDKYALLKNNPVPTETFLSDKGSPLMARTVSKAAATAAAAIGSVRQLPSVVKPPLATVRTMTLGGYRVVSTAGGVPKWFILAGAALVVLGVAFAIQSVDTVGITGLAMAGVGAYLIVLGTWQRSSRLLFALLSVTAVGFVLSMGTPVVSRWLFGAEARPGLVGRNVYWLGAQWWHPLAAVAALAALAILIGAANPRRK